MVIKWSDFAKNNLRDFITYSRLSSPKEYARELVSKVYLLEDNPRLGKFIFYVDGIETRQLIHKAHKIIYRIKNNEIHIGAVLHTSKDLKTSLKFVNRFFEQ